MSSEQLVAELKAELKEMKEASSDNTEDKGNKIEVKMKKYRLLKDLPTFKAGQIFGLAEDGEIAPSKNPIRGQVCLRGGLWLLDNEGVPEVFAYAKQTLDRFPNILAEWFEEVELTDFGKLKDGDLYYYIASDGEIVDDTYDNTAWDHDRIKIGNYFKNAEAAQRAVKSLEAIARLREIGLEFYDWHQLQDDNFCIFAKIPESERHLITICDIFTFLFTEEKYNDD